MAISRSPGASAATRAPGPRVPLKELGSPWSFAEVEFSKPIQTHRGPKPGSFPGYVIRVPDDLGRRLGLKRSLYAVSRICPHEGCLINFYKSRSEAPFPSELLELKEFPNPLLICACHQSVFDPAQGGKVLSGPSPRPPWVFEFTVEKGEVVIKEMEAGGDQWG